MRCKTSYALAALLLALLSFSACTNQDGAGGTVDGTDENNYELNQDHLAPPMDSVKAPSATDTLAKDSAATPPAH
jgi:hypothetical protein